jgi:hypothetical protein
VFQDIGDVASKATKGLSAGSKLGTLTKIGNFLGGTGFENYGASLLNILNSLV